MLNGGFSRCMRTASVLVRFCSNSVRQLAIVTFHISSTFFARLLVVKMYEIVCAVLFFFVMDDDPAVARTQLMRRVGGWGIW